MFAGGVLVGAGVALGVWMSPRLGPRVEEPKLAPDPPARRPSSYELLREHVGETPTVPALARHLIASTATVATATVTRATNVPGDAEPTERPSVEAPRAGARPGGRNSTTVAKSENSSQKSAKSVPRTEKSEPRFTAEALAEARSMLAEVEALKNAPDAELRDRVRALSTRAATEERVVAARDRCAKAYQSLLDGLDRLERLTTQIAEREAAGGATDVPELRAELERADAAAEAAKRGVLACEVGLARLRAAYGLTTTPR
ncbi:hypothetical protein L6R52_13935 [Myxococcota bacterium]|nr:hypothetical protein [Myxococcota bacterium]